MKSRQCWHSFCKSWFCSYIMKNIEYELWRISNKTNGYTYFGWRKFLTPDFEHKANRIWAIFGMSSRKKCSLFNILMMKAIYLLVIDLFKFSVHILSSRVRHSSLQTVIWKTIWCRFLAVRGRLVIKFSQVSGEIMKNKINVNFS
jgi:hypothetical protein